MESVGQLSFGIIAGLVIVALAFDFMNGFHDAANSIATVVSTRVLKPYQAVVWAAFFNFVAAFVFGTKVSETISSGLVDPKVVDIWVVFGGLLLVSGFFHAEELERLRALRRRTGPTPAAQKAIDSTEMAGEIVATDIERPE